MASAPQGMGRALAPVGALPPYLPEDSSPSPTRRTHTQQREKGEYRERKQFPQLGKNISPTRKIEKRRNRLNHLLKA